MKLTETSTKAFSDKSTVFLSKFNNNIDFSKID